MADLHRAGELHPDEDLLLDLALSDVQDHQRDALTDHLALCEPCRTIFAGITDSVDHVLAAAPWVAPPAGFSGSVLAAMGMTEREAPADVAAEPRAAGGPFAAEGRRAGAHHHQDAPPSRTPRSRPILAGLVAACLVLLGVAGAAFLLGARRTPPATQELAGPAIVRADGTQVGTVLPSTYEGEPILVVALTQGPDGVRYDCQLVLADGSRESAGSWRLRGSNGATWVLEVPPAEVTGLELVTDSGKTWATADL